MPHGCCTPSYNGERNMATILFGVYRLSGVHPLVKSLIMAQLQEGEFLPRQDHAARSTQMGQDSTWKRCLTGSMFSFPAIVRPWFPWNCLPQWTGSLVFWT